MKLNYYLDNFNKKIYTLKEISPKGEKTKSAHYKYIKIKSSALQK